MSLKLKSVAALLAICLSSGAQTVGVERIAANDTNPVSTIMRVLEKRYGWFMTYEDPPWQNLDELVDSTHPEYKRLHPGEAPAYAVRPHRLEFNLTAPDGQNRPGLDDTMDVVLQSHMDSGNPGFFAYDHIGAYLHVRPVKARLRDGQIVPWLSIMETKVSFPKAQRRAYDALMLVLSQVSEASHQTINPATIPTNGLMTASGEHGAEDRPAREVLTEIFEDINRLNVEFFNHPAHIVWDLMYDPTFKAYYFNAHFVVVEKKGAFGATVRQQQ